VLVQNLRTKILGFNICVGGAERLVVDYALALQKREQKVLIFTSNHPHDHCFPETLNILKVEVIVQIDNC
jgi:alpha-1,3/alpha-1,6-mannosyltransferase